MAQPIIHLLERYGNAYHYWGQVVGVEGDSQAELISYIKSVHSEIDPSVGFEVLVDTLLLSLQVIPPSTMSRWIYTDPVKPLQSGQGLNQNALIL